MAKTETTKTILSLDSETKRLLRNLTRAVDRLAATKWTETEGASGVKRLSEPAEDPKTHGIEMSAETIRKIAEAVGTRLEV